MRRKAYVYHVQSDDYISFCEVLRSREQIRNVSNRRVEILFSSEDNDVIKGIFVSTQTKNLPPKHTPGNDDDFTAIEMPLGGGLAYPNAFLYDTISHLLFLEVNSMGMDQTRLVNMFRSIDEQTGGHINCVLQPVMRNDFFTILRRMSVVKSADFTVFDPVNALSRDDIAISDMRSLAESTGTPKSIKVTITAERRNTLSIDDLIRKAQSLFAVQGANCKIKGVVFDDEGREVNESIMFANYIHTYTFDIPNETGSIHQTERLDGIEGARNRHIHETER